LRGKAGQETASILWPEGPTMNLHGQKRVGRTGNRLVEVLEKWIRSGRLLETDRRDEHFQHIE
jgi:hypothetical protein